MSKNILIMNLYLVEISIVLTFNIILTYLFLILFILAMEEMIHIEYLSFNLYS